MNVRRTALPGVLVIEPLVHADDRGFFLETFQLSRYRQQAEIGLEFVQENHSRSEHGVLRGLHGQQRRPQGKLVRVSRGAVFDVAADADPASPTFGQWVGETLSDENHRQLWIPPGYLHGFVVLSDVADFEYKCTDYYDPDDEFGIVWNDPTLGIEWPIANPTLSAKDANLPSLQSLG